MSGIFSFLSLAVLLVSAAPGLAQQKVEYVGYAGVYTPLNSTIDKFGVRLKQKSAFALGGRGTLWLEESLAFEGGFVFNFSDVEREDSEGVTEESSHVWFATGRALYKPGETASAASFFVGAGLTVTSRGGTAYSSITGTTDIGGTIGVGTSIVIGKRYAIRIEAEDYFSWARFNVNLATETSTRFQNDLVFSAGLAVPIVR